MEGKPLPQPRLGEAAAGVPPQAAEVEVGQAKDTWEKEPVITCKWNGRGQFCPKKGWMGSSPGSK